MDVDNDIREALFLQVKDHMLQHGFSSNLYQCLWHGVGEGLQAGAESGSKDKCFHFLEL
jgi:hypothetical protein